MGNSRAFHLPLYNLGVIVSVSTGHSDAADSREIPMRLSQIAGLSVALLVLTCGLCKAQSDGKPTESDLAKFSSEQLRACFDDAKICGSGDVYSISDELARRIPKLPSEQLVLCFEDWKICGVGEDQASGWPISDELARRGNLHELLARYWKEPKWAIRGGIEHIAYHFESPEVTSFMRKILVERLKDGEDLYWPVNYRVRRRADAVVSPEGSSLF